MKGCVAQEGGIGGIQHSVLQALFQMSQFDLVCFILICVKIQEECTVTRLPC